jgi:hypothetical protein
MNTRERAERSISLGASNPYDGDHRTPRGAARLAVLGILADLNDRRGVKHELYLIDSDVRREITQELEAIVQVVIDDYMQGAQHLTLDAPNGVRCAGCHVSIPLTVFCDTCAAKRS